MDSSSSFFNTDTFGETHQLGLALSEKKPKKNNIDIVNHMDLYQPEYEQMQDHIFLGPQGPLLEQMSQINDMYRMSLNLII